MTIDSRRIDIVGVKDSQLIAIEVKVKNWKRAFQQAMIYRICADKVWVAIWHRYVDNVDQELYDKHGIGIMSIHEKGLEIIRKPKPVEIVHENLQNKLRKRLERERSENIKTLL